MRYFIYFLMGWFLFPMFVDAQTQLNSPRVGDPIAANIGLGEKNRGVWTERSAKVENRFLSEVQSVYGDKPAFLEEQRRNATDSQGTPIIVNTKAGQKILGTYPQSTWNRKSFIPSGKSLKGGPSKEQLVQAKREKRDRNIPGNRRVTAPVQVCIWTGTNSTDWFDPGNWNSEGIPSAGDLVIIQNVNSGNYPKIEDEFVDIGGLTMAGAKLNIINGGLSTERDFDIDNSEITISGSNSFIRSFYSESPSITSSIITGSDAYVSIAEYTGSASIYNNIMDVWYFHLEQEIDPFYDDEEGISSMMFGNTIYGHLFIDINNRYDEFYLANGTSAIDEIYGELSITINHSLTYPFAIGLGGIAEDDEPLIVHGNVTIDRKENHSVEVVKITFSGNNFQNFYARIPDPLIGWGDLIILGTPLEIEKLFFRKTGRSLEFMHPVHVTKQLYMGDAFAFISSKRDRMLTLTKDAVVVDEDPLYGSFVFGYLEKITNSEFTFPMGADVGIPFRPGTSDPIPSPGARPMELYGSFKAPLSISAPNRESSFIAG